MNRYAIGLDYGTNSCRSLLVNIDTGEELGSVVFPYPSGHQGILTDPGDPNLARQNPQDYLDGAVTIITGAIAQAKESNPDFNPDEIIGLGVDTTGSTIIPVDAEGTPLALKAEFADNLNAHVWLWKDHTAFEAAADITAMAGKMRPEYLEKCGGTYSSEWWWSKIWQCKKVDETVFNAADSWVEHCDWLPGVFTGNERPDRIKRSVCAAGHKAMYSDNWGGLPDEEFLNALDPALGELRSRLYSDAVDSQVKAGELTAEWAGKLGLREGLPVAVGAFDAHMGAVGSGVKAGTLVKILGTSTCDVTVLPADAELGELPGVCGIADGSVLPNHYGIEAGQSAVGDIFLWFVNHLVPDSYGATNDEKFIEMGRRLSEMKPGESGLMALDWNNGNRTILTDVRLTGMILGQTLHTEAHEIYRALIEATAFGALTIINRMEEYGVKIKEVVNTGGLSVKNEALMQMYSDILQRPLKVAASDQTCALGAAIFGAACGGSVSIGEVQSNCCQVREKTYSPIPENSAVYEELYAIYKTLHDAFGTSEWQGGLGHVMKDLIRIRQEQRNR
ncbi:ribulokinase [Verrucomicrobiales bacterium BCK34]|nr:ribulokinase [Verrucomicrobiales bacterium BCK34]